MRELLFLSFSWAKFADRSRIWPSGLPRIVAVLVLPRGVTLDVQGRDS